MKIIIIYKHIKEFLLNMINIDTYIPSSKILQFYKEDIHTIKYRRD